MLERQREGIAKAKTLGRYKGRVSTAKSKSAEFLRLKSKGVRPTEIASRLGIGRANVFGCWESSGIAISGCPLRCGCLRRASNGRRGPGSSVMSRICSLPIRGAPTLY